MAQDIYSTKTLELDDSLYPILLKEIPNPPKTLFYKGDLSNFSFKRCLGIVGSRKISSYGTAAIQYIFKDLAATEISIVSGFMRGVDCMAHTLSLQYNIPTVAVLPCGIDEVYPYSQRDLYQNIIKNGGLILSEFPRNEMPRDWMFVKRNRIIAGLSNVLLVIEAGINSGSLITYNYAKKYKRKVLAVPGDLFRESEAGICHILRDSATAVFSGLDVNVELGLQGDKKTILLPLPNVICDKVFICINNAPCNIEQLTKTLKIDITLLTASLTDLQLLGYVQEIKGVFYACKG